MYYIIYTYLLNHVEFGEGLLVVKDERLSARTPPPKVLLSSHVKGRRVYNWTLELCV